MAIDVEHWPVRPEDLAGKNLVEQLATIGENLPQGMRAFVESKGRTYTVHNMPLVTERTLRLGGFTLTFGLSETQVTREDGSLIFGLGMLGFRTR